MEASEIEKNKNQLLEIVEKIISLLFQEKKKKGSLSVKDVAKQLYSFKVVEGNKDVQLFYYFASKLFLDDKGNFDFDIDKLKMFIPSPYIHNIFEELVDCYKSKSFFDFLYRLGDIFRDIYYNIDNFKENESLYNNFFDITEKYNHKGINNYECMFILLSKCKKNDKKDEEKDIKTTDKKNEINRKYIYGNYDSYFSETYLIEMKYNLILSFNAYIKLCISSPTFDDLQEIIMEDENTTSDSQEKNIKVTECEKIILKNLRTFWVNSYFLFSENLDIFSSLFYEFITSKNTNNFILNNEYDENEKQFLEYLSNDIQRLFMNYDEDSFDKFGQSLSEFLNNNKNKNIKFVDLAIKIGEYNNLDNCEIGLISFICCNKKLLNNIKEIVDSFQKIPEGEELGKVIDDYGFSNYELYIFNYLLNEKIVQINESKNTGTDSNNEINTTNPKLENIISSGPIKEKDNIANIKFEKQQFADDPKYSYLISLIDELKKEFEEKNQKHSKEMNELRKECEAKNQKHIKEMNELRKECEAKNQKHNKEINVLNKKIENLENIHKIIYFRDVSKYYIQQFSEKYDINGENNFQKCQNILSYDFTKKNIQYLEKIIIKIVTQYLNGNKYAHMEYFMTKSKSFNRINLAKEIENSYMEFMKFKENEKNSLIDNFKLSRAPFIYSYFSNLKKK